MQSGSLPGYLGIVAIVVVQLDNYLRRHTLVVGHSQVQISHVAPVLIALVVGGNLVGCNVECVAGGQGYGLVDRGVVDWVLANEFQRIVCSVELIYSKNAFGQRYAQIILLAVGKLDFVGSDDVVLRAASSADTDQIVFPDSNIQGLCNELDLFLGILVEGN